MRIKDQFSEEQFNLVCNGPLAAAAHAVDASGGGLEMAS
jgi:hypothetical protein